MTSILDSNYRIEENTIVRILKDNDYASYFVVNNQYIEATTQAWKNTVFVDSKRINKLFGFPFLVDYPIEIEPVEEKSYLVEVMLKQGFDFDHVTGFLVVVMDITTGTCYASKLLKQTDFQITADRLLIEGKFYLTSAKFNIPNKSRNLAVGIVAVADEDIILKEENYGFITNFPSDYIPLIDEKPLDDTIKNRISLDENFYLIVQPYSVFPEQTIESAIVEYLGLQESEGTNIKVRHLINYGNDEFGYYEIGVENRVNKYAPIKIGLDFTPFKERQSKVNINVTTEYSIGTFIMERTTTIQTDPFELVNPLIAEIISLPTQKNIVQVVKQENIVQNVIQTNTEREIVQITKPIYVETQQNDEIILEKKRIRIPAPPRAKFIIKPAPEIGKLADEQVIEATAEYDETGLATFDLSTAKAITDKTTYEIIDENNVVIRRGRILPPPPPAPRILPTSKNIAPTE